MLGFLKSNSVPIGIDFGYTAVKLLQIVPGDPHELIAAAQVDIPEHIRSDVAERSRFLRDALPAAIQNSKFRGKVAVCSIPAWQTFMQHLQVDKGNAASILNQVKSQLQATIGCDPERAVIRHIEVSDVFRHGQPMREAICFAVSRDIVMNQVELLKKCKLEAGGLHGEPIALLNAYRHLYRRDGDDQTTTMYLDLGNFDTRAMIGHGSVLRFAKTIPVGGRHFDQDIAKALNCDEQAAHVHRMQEIGAEGFAAPDHANVGESALGQSGEMSSGGVGGMLSVASHTAAQTQPSQLAIAQSERRHSGIPREFRALQDRVDDDSTTSQMGEKSLVREAMADGVLQIVDELRMCVRYHRSLFPDREISRIILNGGESRDSELCRYIASILGLNAYVGDPLKRVQSTKTSQMREIGKLNEQPGWAVAIGLCLTESSGE